jgi:pectate lyase
MRRPRLLVGAAVLAAATFGSVSLASVASAAADVKVTATIAVSGTFDGGGNRYIGSGDLGDGGQNEGQDPLFRLANGATLSNVILGAPAADGVHCSGSCTLRNVTWQDVGEDAATFRGTNATVVIDGGSAAKASDKVFQDNRGAGGSVTIRNFTVNDFGKLYRSCGNCSTQAARSVTMQNITASNGDVLVGININYGDRARLSGLNVGGIGICDLFNGNNSGDEPVKVGEGPNSTNCIVS